MNQIYATQYTIYEIQSRLGQVSAASNFFFLSIRQFINLLHISYSSNSSIHLFLGMVVFVTYVDYLIAQRVQHRPALFLVVGGAPPPGLLPHGRLAHKRVPAQAYHTLAVLRCQELGIIWKHNCEYVNRLHCRVRTIDVFSDICN